METITKSQYVQERSNLDEQIEIKQAQLDELCKRRDALDNFYAYYGTGDKSDLPKDKQIGPRNLVRNFAKNNGGWFRNKQLSKSLDKEFPGHGLNTNRLSTVLIALVDRKELLVEKGKNRRLGNRYRWNEKDHQTTFVEVG